MDQYLNNKQNEILWRLLANPADNGSLYGFNLQQLAKDFPQSGLLQALLARSGDSGNLPHAAATFNTKTLYVVMNAYENLAEVSEEQIVQELHASASYGSTAQQDEPVMKLNDFSDGKLKDILGFEPVSHFDEPAEKVIVADDERHEVETLDFVREPEQATTEESVSADHEPINEFQEQEIAEETISADADPLKELQETSIAPEIITPEDIEEPTTITEAFAEAEIAAELPAEDHRAELIAIPHEEEIISLPEVHAEEHSVAETPVEDHRTAADLSPYEEEVIEVPEEEKNEPVAEMQHEDGRAEISAPPFEEEVTVLPDHEPVEEQTEHIVQYETVAEQPIAEDQQEEPAETRHYGSFGDIDDEVFDEITDIDSISFAFAQKSPPEPVAAELPQGETALEGQEERPAEEHDSRDEIGRLMSQELISADYLAFDNARRHEPDSSATEEPEVFTAEPEIHTGPVGKAAAEQTYIEADTQHVSKYHDEKMPYTFMWWLDKTRKEHAGIYQPFKLDTTQAIRHTADDMLQQQYYENIFHVSTVEELEKDAEKPPVEFDIQNKEDRIIQKFLVEDPQIGPPTSDKLGNENKAKKSSEDQDEMVTETLAKIYVDQMLYHKAINTYKKLILKFPEKSRYFADQIEMLERKIN